MDDIADLLNDKRISTVDHDDFKMNKKYNQTEPIMSLMLNPDKDAVKGSELSVPIAIKSMKSHEHTITRMFNTLDEIYLIVECNEDDIDHILDTLVECEIQFIIGGMIITQFNLGFCYFLSSYLEHQIQHIDRKKLLKDMDMKTNLFNSSKLSPIYQKVVMKCSGDHYIVIPLHLKFILPNLIMAQMNWMEFQISIKTKNDHSMRVGIDGHMTSFKIAQTLTKFQTLTTTLNSKKDKVLEYDAGGETEISFGERISNEYKSYGTRTDYVMIIIQPNYDKINDNLMLKNAADFIPVISEICIDSKPYPIELIDVKKSRTQNIYFFTADPDRAMGDIISDRLKENKDITRHIRDTLDDITPIPIPTPTPSNSVRIHNITIKIEPYAMPIKIGLTTIFTAQSKLIDGLFGTLLGGNGTAL